MPSRPWTGSLLHWTQFSPDCRAGLNQDSTDVAGKVPGSSSGASGSPRHLGKESCQHVCMKTSFLWRATHTGSLLAPVVRRQVFSQTWFPRPESRWARWDCQGRAGRGVVPLSSGHAYLALRCFLSAGGSPGQAGSWGAGRDGKWPSPTDRRAACLCFASWMVGAVQAECTQP